MVIATTFFKNVSCCSRGTRCGMVCGKAGENGSTGIMELDGQQSDQDAELDHLFLNDIRSRMASIADCIFRLEEQSEHGERMDFQLIATLMREFHTVKACADFDNISTLAHVAHNVEDLLELFLKEHIEPDRSHLDLLYTVIDFTLQIIGDIHIPEEDVRRDADELIRVVNVKLGELTELIGQQARRNDGQDNYLAHQLDDLDRLDEQYLQSAEARRVKGALDELKAVLIGLESGDGELAASSRRGVELLRDVMAAGAWPLPEGLQKLLNELKATLQAAAKRPNRPEGCELGILSDVLVVIRNCYASLFRGKAGKITGFEALAELISDIRWQLRVNIPVAPFLIADEAEAYVPLNIMAANVRKLTLKAAREMGKKVQFSAQADSVEIQTSYAGKLNVALAHLIRNAVDHGIESEQERLRCGKDPVGTVTFKAALCDQMLCITVQDDGRGLQRDRIVQKAVQRGLIPADGAGVDVVELIMRPGFSTADVPTMYSGRGMGMGIVKGNVAEMGGRLEVESEPGRGTLYRMFIPAGGAWCRRKPSA